MFSTPHRVKVLGDMNIINNKVIESYNTNCLWDVYEHGENICVIELVLRIMTLEKEWHEYVTSLR